MTIAAEALKTQLSILPANDRAELAKYLIDSLDETTDGDVEAAWDEVLARRDAEIRSGTVVGEPAESVFTRLRDKYS